MSFVRIDDEVYNLNMIVYAEFRINHEYIWGIENPNYDPNFKHLDNSTKHDDYTRCPCYMRISEQRISDAITIYFNKKSIIIFQNENPKEYEQVKNYLEK